jgi:hypothetical protein
MIDGYAVCQMIFENDQPQDFVYLAVNKSFEELTGLRDVVGKRSTEVIPGIKKSNPEVFKIYGMVASTGHPERFEMYVDPLNSWFCVSAVIKRDFRAVFEKSRTQAGREPSG